MPSGDHFPLFILCLPAVYCAVVGLALFWQHLGGRVARAVVWQFVLAVVLTAWMNSWLALSVVENHVKPAVIETATRVTTSMWPVMLFVAVAIFFLPMAGVVEEQRRDRVIVRPISRRMVWLNFLVLLLLPLLLMVVFLAAMMA